MRSIIGVSLVFLSLVTGSAVAADADWLLAMGAISPPARSARAMTYDSARGRVVLFAGWYSETWEWDGNTWLEVTPTTSPPPRSGHAMAYDSRRGRVVLFGGQPSSAGSGHRLSDTWEWDGSSWVEVTPTTSPPARRSHAMAYDSMRGRVVLFGGDGGPGSSWLGDTWEWDGSMWLEATPASSPPARSFHAMDYDSARGYAVLFGGYGVAGNLGDTWEWDGSAWVEAMTATPPPARSGHAMAYDSKRGRLVLFGGGPGDTELYLGDTWEWDGSQWLEAKPATSPSARSGHAMTYDGQRGRVVLFGGSSGSPGDTWEWDGSSWVEATPVTSPPQSSSHAMAYDSTRGRVVLFRGAETWEWDGSSWVEATPAASPPGRAGHAMAYDSARGRVVLFGGSSGSYLGDTWEWDGSKWVEVTPAMSPPARHAHAMAYDSTRGRVVLFGGRNLSGPSLRDTWEWDGSRWVEATPATSPQLRSFHAMAYDNTRRRVVLFGGYSNAGGGGTYSGETWEWDGSTWVEATPAASPPGRYYHAMAHDSIRGRVVLFGGVLDSGRLGDTWEWDGSTWVETTPATSPPARAAHAMAYDSLRGRVVLFGGSWFGDTWEYDASGVDTDNDGYSGADGDCDDADRHTYPEAPELCDGVDNQCPGDAGYARIDEGFSDSDGDGITDCVDNCVGRPNTTQSDLDHDGIGDPCDNCVTTWNTLQADTDHNGVGDHCDCVCGDGVRCTTGEEECDDGNRIDDDRCSNGCSLNLCGDGIVNAGEACDDGNNIDNDQCSNSCADRLVSYVALGDSFSSGEGAPYRIALGDFYDTYEPSTNEPEDSEDIPQNTCHRGSAYSSWFGAPFSQAPIEELARHLTGFAWEHEACSGARARNVSTTAQFQNQGPQVMYLTADTDFVTLTIGGDDLGFRSKLLTCYAQANCPAFSEREVREKVVAVVKGAIDAVLDAAENATVFLLGYPKLFMDAPQVCSDVRLGSSGLQLDAGEQDNLNTTTDRLNRVLLEIAREKGVHFVPVAFEGHELCSGNDRRFLWGDRADDGVRQNEDRRAARFHPTRDGQREYWLDLRTYIIDTMANEPQLRDDRGFLRNPMPQPASKRQREVSTGTFSTYAEADLRSLVPGGCTETGVFGPGEQVLVSADDFSADSPVLLIVTDGVSTTFDFVTSGSDGCVEATFAVPEVSAPPAEAVVIFEGTNDGGGSHQAAAIFEIGPAYGTDLDGDGVDDICDICPLQPDPTQVDTDGDGAGDLCDACPLDSANDRDNDGLCVGDDPCPLDPLNDLDGDGVCGDEDLCPQDHDRSQQDIDLDGIGDECDPCTDTDFDGFGDPGFPGNECEVDDCPAVLNVDQSDQDYDGRGDLCDNCVSTYNPDQQDDDNDRVGDACDCDPKDSGTSRAPNLVHGVEFPAPGRIRWAPDEPGAGVVYTVVRGLLSKLPVGDLASEVCLTPATTGTQTVDVDLPTAGNGFYYVVRGRNSCADGSYGSRSSGSARVTTACRDMGW